MTTDIIRFLNTVMAGLLAGILLGICLGYNPRNLSAGAYIEQQQNAISALNTLMPLVGLCTIILTLISSYLQKSNNLVFVTLLIAAILLIISGLITRFGNQPLNTIVMTFKKENVPSSWTELRDKWWSFHIMRTITALIAFILIAWMAIRKN